MARPNKITFKEVADSIISLAERHIEENDRILVKVDSFQTNLQRNKGIVVSNSTLRNYGFNPQGYWVKEFPDYFDYYTEGSTRERGLVIYCDKVVENQEEIKDNLP